MSLITHQFQDLCNNSISNLMLQDEFKVKIEKLLNTLSSKSLQELTKIVKLKTSTANPSLDLGQKLFEFTHSCLESLNQENCREFQQKLDRIISSNLTLDEKFKEWQLLFQQLLAQHKEKLEEAIWIAYLEQQKSKALDLSDNKEIKGAFEAFSYQALAESPLRRLGSLIFELFSGIANGLVYRSSEGKRKLFLTEIDHANSSRASSGEEEIKKMWKGVTGNEYLPISAPPKPQGL